MSTDEVTITTTSTTRAPLLAPIDLPLSPGDVGLPDVNAVELVLEPDRMGFCGVPIDLSRTTEVRTSLINDFNANDQVAQQAVQFESEAAAEAFLDEVAASLTCRSWSSDTVDGTQNYATEAVEIVPSEIFGDETRAWDSTTTFENGFVVRQRSYMMRRHDRVLGVFVLSDEAGRIEMAPTFMELMVDRLGYDI